MHISLLNIYLHLILKINLNQFLYLPFVHSNPLKVKKVEEIQISMRFRVSGSTGLEIKVRDPETGILVNKETTSKFNIRY